MQKSCEMRKCKVCGALFIPNRANKVVCSIDCQKLWTLKIRRDWHKKKREEKIKMPKPCTCEICAALFQAERKGQKYCSPECKRKGLNMLNRESYERRKLKAQGHAKEAKCPICGKSFEIRRRSQKCCSPECSLLYAKRKRAALANNYYISDIDWLNCQLEKAKSIVKELFKSAGES